MRRVSFSVAKAIKEAGYPQDWNDCDYYYTENGILKHSDNYEGYSFEDIMYYQRNAVPAPYAMEVWLWLWREKGYAIECIYKHRRFYNYKTSYGYADPEEAIIAAIDFLIENKLLN